MKKPPIPEGDRRRVAALRRTALLDSEPETAFDDFAKLAAHIAGTPIALVTLIDEHRQWFKARFGTVGTGSSRDTAFCAHAIVQSDVFIVPDVLADERFHDNPYVVGEPHVRFYAGAPFTDNHGSTLGALCVLDRVPRELTNEQCDALARLAALLSSHVDLRRKALELDNDATQKREVQRMKDEFISIVSHELRTPLTSIRGALGLLEGGVVGQLAEEASELVRIARSNADRLSKLVNDILDLETMEAGKLELQRSEVDVRALVDAAVEGVATLARDADVTIETNVSADARVVVDEHRIGQLLINLLSNAIKFSPRGSHVHVSAVRRDPHTVRLSVTDEGPGIPETRVGQLFEKFQQLDSSDDRARGGTGLGLAISRAIAEQHGGVLGVDTRAGEGATFYADLPAVGLRRS
jgi:signal transduction histidine kinase